MIWSNALINPQKWLKKRFKDLNSKIQHLDSKTDRIDQNVKIIKGELEYALDERGLLILHIEIENELSEGVRGDIIFDDNYRQPYRVSSLGSEDIVPQDDLNVKEITGTTDSGVVCEPFVLEEDEEPKRKFHIVWGEERCVILPASEQYHHIAPTNWQADNGELVSQQDYFHPGTREAILKTEAHADNHATTMIFQAREATKSRRSSGVGLMVTAAGAECHVNELTDEIGVNPEHILVPKAKTPDTRGRINNRAEEGRITHKYITNSVISTKIISPDDENVKLTETMKKACEGKTIFYNSQHVVESDGKKHKGGVVNDAKNSRMQRLSSQIPNTTSKKGERGFCRDVKNKFSETTAASCGMWSYGGVVYTNDTNPFEIPETPKYDHFHSIWTVQAQCCNDGPNDNGYYDKQFFPCAEIREGNSVEAEQAFSTAYALSIGKYRFDKNAWCMGTSRFCQWSDDDVTYSNFNLTVSGACTSRCTSYCNNFQNSLFTQNNAVHNVTDPNGCFKCFGMYPGFLNENDPYYVNPEYMDHSGWYRGPCTP